MVKYFHEIDFCCAVGKETTATTTKNSPRIDEHMEMEAERMRLKLYEEWVYITFSSYSIQMFICSEFLCFFVLEE